MFVIIMDIGHDCVRDTVHVCVCVCAGRSPQSFWYLTVSLKIRVFFGARVKAINRAGDRHEH
jgi:hypothetical protein